MTSEVSRPTLNKVIILSVLNIDTFSLTESSFTEYKLFVGHVWLVNIELCSLCCTHYKIHWNVSPTLPKCRSRQYYKYWPLTEGKYVHVQFHWKTVGSASLATAMRSSAQFWPRSIVGAYCVWHDEVKDHQPKRKCTYVFFIIINWGDMTT